MDKKKLLNDIERLRISVQNDDIDSLLEFKEIIGVDYARNSKLVDFIKSRIISIISSYIKNKGLENLHIKTLNVYNDKTQDVYELREGKLFRNGHITTYDSIGKLYQAYNFIKTESYD